MSVFKKITSFFFDEEDSDVVVEDEIEDISIHDDKKVNQESIVEEKIVEEQKVTEPLHVDDKVEKPDMMDESREVVKMNAEKKKAVRIDLDDNFSNKPNKVRVKRKEEKKEYEPTPIISPMYGESQNGDEKDNSNSMVTSLTRKQKNNPLNMVISPYFGVRQADASQPEVKAETPDKEVNPDVHPAQNEKEEAVVEDVKIEIPHVADYDSDSTVTETIEETIREEEEMGVSLEEMIANDDASNQDLMQISFFGDPTPIADCNSNENEKK